MKHENTVIFLRGATKWRSKNCCDPFTKQWSPQVYKSRSPSQSSPARLHRELTCS